MAPPPPGPRGGRRAALAACRGTTRPARRGSASLPDPDPAPPWGEQGGGQRGGHPTPQRPIPQHPKRPARGCGRCRGVRGVRGVPGSHPRAGESPGRAGSVPLRSSHGHRGVARGHRQPPALGHPSRTGGVALPPLRGGVGIVRTPPRLGRCRVGDAQTPRGTRRASVSPQELRGCGAGGLKQKSGAYPAPWGPPRGSRPPPRPPPAMPPLVRGVPVPQSRLGVPVAASGGDPGRAGIACAARGGRARLPPPNTHTHTNPPRSPPVPPRRVINIQPQRCAQPSPAAR